MNDLETKQLEIERLEHKALVLELKIALLKIKKALTEPISVESISAAATDMQKNINAAFRIAHEAQSLIPENKR